MPGIDSHAHPADARMTELIIHPEMQNIADVLGYIRQRAEVLEDGEWIWVSHSFSDPAGRGTVSDERGTGSGGTERIRVVFRTGPMLVNSLALKAEWYRQGLESG